MVRPFLLLFLILSFSTVSAQEHHQPNVEFTVEEQRFIEQHPVIRVGGEKDWPPFDFVQNGEYTGAAKDYLDLLSLNTGLTFEIKTGPSWDSLLQSIKRREIDLLPMIFWSQKRTEYLNYTDTFLMIRHYVFIHEDTEMITSMTDLENKTLAIPKSFAQIELLKSQYPNVDILEVESPLEAIDAVITKRVDGLIENTAMISYLKKENNIQGLKAAFVTDIGIHDLYMATRKDWPRLRDIIQKGLDKITQAQSDKIAHKWITFDNANNAPLTPKKIVLSEQQQRYLVQKKTIKACIDPDWMPIERLEKGKYIGMGADYLKLLQQKIGVPIDVLPTKDWAESLDIAENKQCDIFVLSMDIQPQQSYMDITTPYLKLPVVIATKLDVVFISNLEEVASQKIGILEGCALADSVKQANPDVNFVMVPSKELGLEMVANDELFGMMDNLYSLSHEIQKHHYGELKIGGKLGVNWDLGIATRKDEPILNQIFEQALATISTQARQEIINRWTPIEYVQTFDYNLMWKIVAAFSLLLVATFFRNRRLIMHQTEIAQKNHELAKINRQLQAQKTEVQHHADHDFLTGLPNRKKVNELLDHAIQIAKRQQQQIAVLFLDLDRFKNINDSFGHHVGDDVLRETAERLKKRLRVSDTIARIGGDEFLIVLETNQDVKDAAVTAENILAEIRKPIYINDHSYINSGSIGIALFPGDGQDASTLIKCADSAMYLAKEHGKDSYQYYTQKLSEQIQRRLYIEHALRNAIKNEQLSILFQPQIELKQQQIVGVEVLVRWLHPELGFVSPSEFIPIAEETGLIVEIGEWVFRNACQTFSSWQKSGFMLDSLAINVSSVQFNQSNVTDTFSAIIDEFNIPAKNIEIEITERYIMADTEQNNHFLQSLREIGFRISVDDFGTGYSSMSYLKTLPLDIIKIDKSFTNEIPHDNNDLQIVEAILALSHSLGYIVVAEGIEKLEQLEILQAMSCDIGQGYYFNKPLPADELISIYGPQNHS